MAHESEQQAAWSQRLPTVARRALALEHLAVKEGGMLWIADPSGDVRPPVALPDDSTTSATATLGHTVGLGPVNRGLFHASVCYLSCCVLEVEGRPLPSPSAAETQGYEATLAFPELGGQRGDLSALRTFLADGTAVYQWITIETQAAHSVPISLTITFGADFRVACTTLGESAVSRRGIPHRPTLSGRKLRFTCDELAGYTHHTTVAFDRLPHVVRWLEAEERPDGVPLLEVTFHLNPALAEPATLAFAVAPSRRAAASPAAPFAAVTSPPAVFSFDCRTATHELRRRHARWHLAGALYHTSAPVVGAVLRRSAADFRLLLEPTGIGSGMVPIAALPTSGTFRGRDALLAAFQALALNPQIAVDTLRFLARHQLVEDDAHSGQLAGMIPHELPHRALAGAEWKRPLAWSSDALETTPLWIALLAETLDWTGERDLLEDLLPAAWRALAWIESAESRFAHGYLVCHGHIREGALGQASAHDGDDAEQAVSPEARLIAPVAAQASVYLARRTLARVLRRRGTDDHRARAVALERAAEHLRRRIERDFWLGEEGCYAPALDAAGRPVRVVTSSAAYVLWARLPGAAHTARLAERLLQADLKSNWGLRTRSADDPAYDPLDAHDGCVSPLETALAAAGLWRARQAEAASRLARRLFTAAAAHVDARLPLVLPGSAGTERGTGASPERSVARGPAAVSAASPFGLIAAMLGAEPDALAQQLVLQPALPSWLSTLSIQHLRVGSAYVDLEVQRAAVGGSCLVHSRVTAGELRVVVRPPAQIQV